MVRWPMTELVEITPGVNTLFGRGRTARAVGWACVLITSVCCVGSTLGQTDGAASPLDLLEHSLVKLIADTERSVVSIVRVRKDADRTASGSSAPDGISYRRHPAFVGNDFGAGVILSEDGLILTNRHLVKGGPVLGRDEFPSDSLVVVRFPDRSTSYAKIVAADPRSDLAVIRVMQVPSPLVPLKPYAGSPLRKGQLVVGLGNPYAIGREDGSASAALGMIANTARRQSPPAEPVFEPHQSAKTLHELGWLLAIDMRLNLGTSGGALVNLKGELVGLTTTLAALDGQEKSTGFALPIDGATQRIVDDLMRGLEVEYGFLGISLADEVITLNWQYLAQLRLSGAAQVSDVRNNTPAAKSGLRVNDLIVAVNGSPVTSGNDLTRQIGLLPPGATAELMICRPADAAQADPPPPTMNLKVDLGKWPVIDDEGIIATKRRYEPWRGLVVDFATARDKFQMRRHFNQIEVQQGVMILEVEKDSPASRTEPPLLPGDCITHVAGKPVQTPRQFDTICREIKGGDVSLTLSTGKKVVVGR
jgi:serine protease Do